jgi:hypothetical protein
MLRVLRTGAACLALAVAALLQSCAQPAVLPPIGPAAEGLKVAASAAEAPRETVQPPVAAASTGAPNYAVGAAIGGILGSLLLSRHQ